MTGHWPIAIDLFEPENDFASPSQFVTAVEQLLGPDNIEAVFRTSGRYDAFVFLKDNPETTPEENLQAIMGLPGVRKAIPFPDREHDH